MVCVLLSVDLRSRSFGREQRTHIPQKAIRVVANWNDFEKGAKIIEAPNATCDSAHAIGMSGWYFRKMLTFSVRRSGGLFVDGRSSSVADFTNHGRIIEPPKDIKENRTSAKEPLRAISPNTSVDVLSSSAFFESWR